MSDEEDNLDALFDAFDGDQKEEDGEDAKTDEPKRPAPPQPKKLKTDADATAAENDGKSTSSSTKLVSSIPTGSSRSNSQAVDDDKKSSNGGASSTSMQNPDKPLTSKEQPPQQEMETPKADGESHQESEQKPKNQEEEEREISTGTSHDKSIRTFTAYPDSQALKSLNNEGKQDGDDDEETSKPTDDYTSLPPAKTYPFKLDPFQATSISYITKNQSVLVAAHTSAGKTVVAEYAIAQSLTHNQRVIYTSPIKALSNQKYRDLSEEFGAENVGLMTGDITINPSAICIVMTTEILRSMLYRGSEVMREVAWVVYDEVHYMRDKERGVVWEESIILLPHKVRFVFLSATIPNAKQFVSWIAKIHHQICHVVYTNYRPTPLQHYIFPAGSDGLNLVVDEKGKFREKNFQRAMASLQGSDGGMDAAISDAIGQSGGKGGRKGRNNKRKRGSVGGGKNGHTDLHRIVKLVMERNLNPVIIFSFSKKDCERYALELNKEDYTDEVEKDLISQVYKNAIESLSEDDRLLPQVEALLPLLKRGIGIHHGGLLPILKEIVEILFSEGLIKALFATETFVSHVYCINA